MKVQMYSKSIASDASMTVFLPLGKFGDTSIDLQVEGEIGALPSARNCE
jgi:hypothetical protein